MTDFHTTCQILTFLYVCALLFGCIVACANINKDGKDSKDIKDMVLVFVGFLSGAFAMAVLAFLLWAIYITR